MANKEQLEIIRQGTHVWNRWRKKNPQVIPNLKKANLRKVKLRGANLKDVNFKQANLGEAYLREAFLRGANLSHANLFRANFSQSILLEADLKGALLTFTVFNEASLIMANLNLAFLFETSFHNTVIGKTTFGNVDLSNVKDLLTVKHIAPSSIGTDTLSKSKGKIPSMFLRQCGLSPWELELARIYDPALSPAEISEIISVDIFPKRTEGPLFIGGIFLSYSHDDSKFVDKLYELLIMEGAAVWLDRHDMEAGPIKKQIMDQIRVMDILVIVLSKASLKSDWVENELKIARKKEKTEGRNIICPVALDDTWRTKIEGDPLWGQLENYNILDFSRWKTKQINPQFQKLVNGIKKNYKIFYK